MKTLYDVRHYLNSIPDINRGGCAIAVLAMYRWLRKNKPNANYGFVFNYYSQSKAEKNQKESEKYGAISSCGHALLWNKKSNELRDSTTRKSNTHWELISKEECLFFDDEKILVNAINSGNWRHIFDREQWVEIIGDTLDVDLSDVEVNYVSSFPF